MIITLSPATTFTKVHKRIVFFRVMDIWVTGFVLSSVVLFLAFSDGTTFARVVARTVARVRTKQNWAGTICYKPIVELMSTPKPSTGFISGYTFETLRMHSSSIVNNEILF